MMPPTILCKMKQVELTTDELELISNKRKKQKAQERKDLEEKKKVIEETLLSQQKELKKGVSHYANKLAFARDCFDTLTNKHKGYWELKVKDEVIKEDAYYQQRWGKEYEDAQLIPDKYRKLNKEKGNDDYSFYYSERWHKWSEQEYKDYIHPTKKEWKHYDKFHYGLRIDLPTIKAKVTNCRIQWKEKMKFDYSVYSRDRVVREKSKSREPVSIEIKTYRPKSGYSYSDKWGMLPDLAYGLPQKSQTSYYKEIDVFTYGRYYINLNTITKRVLEQIELYNESVERYLDEKNAKNYTKGILEKLHPNAQRVSDDGCVYFANGVSFRYGTLSKGEKPKITHTGQIEVPNVEDKKVVAELMEFVMNLKIKK